MNMIIKNEYTGFGLTINRERKKVSGSMFRVQSFGFQVFVCPEP
jgi:hypothetical protein